MALYKISSSRVNNIEADQYAGSVVEEGLIWYDPNTGALRLYNGQPGGQLIGGSGTSSEIVNGTSNVKVYPNGPVAVSVNGVANVAVFEGPQAEFNAVHSVGNISTDAYFIGNGSQLTGLTSNYSNANVAAYLPTYTGAVTANTVTATGNISGNSIYLGNVVLSASGTTFLVNGNALPDFGGVMANRGADANNWNNITVMGTYTVSRNSWAGTTGTPLDSQIFVGTLEVMATSTNTETAITQIFYPGITNSDPAVQFNRSNWNGTWTNWYKILNQEQIVSGGTF